MLKLMFMVKFGKNFRQAYIYFCDLSVGLAFDILAKLCAHVPAPLTCSADQAHLAFSAYYNSHTYLLTY